MVHLRRKASFDIKYLLIYHLVFSKIQSLATEVEDDDAETINILINTLRTLVLQWTLALSVKSNQFII